MNKTGLFASITFLIILVASAAYIRPTISTYLNSDASANLASANLALENLALANLA